MSSTLLLDECYEAQGAGFVEHLRACEDDRHLAGLADRLVKDQRPWAREQVLAYLDQPFDRPGHHPLVKRLFKHAEAQADLEAMARCLVGFDRGVRRELVKIPSWDSQTNSASEREILVLRRAGLAAKHPAKHPQAKRVRYIHPRRGMPLFTQATRLYLRRRAWRFFRHLGFRQPEQYVAAITQALVRYTDQDLSGGHDLLESWGLAHALFGESPVLLFQGTWINLAEGKSLADLAPAPAFTAAWQTPAAIPHLLTLAVAARAKLVRTWAQDWLKAHHPEVLRTLPLARLRDLMDGEWEDVRLLGLSLFTAHPQVATLTVQEWIALLTIRDAAALAQVVTTMQAHVRGSRLSHQDVVALACHRAVPVVRMALAFMGEKTWAAPAELAAMRDLARVTCAALAGDLARFLLERLATPERYHVDHVLIALDHRLEGMREVAMAWVDAHRHVRDDALVWARAAETPYDDVRGWLLRALERFTEEAKVAGDQHRLLWATVLLGVHRGGREKQAAVRQVTQAMVNDASRANELLPLLAAALRSLRSPERRAALAGIATVLVRHPALASAIAARFPELDCSRVVLETT
jgi:hypothetical protein